MKEIKNVSAKIAVNRNYSLGNNKRLSVNKIINNKSQDGPKWLKIAIEVVGALTLLGGIVTPIISKRIEAKGKNRSRKSQRSRGSRHGGSAASGQAGRAEA